MLDGRSFPKSEQVQLPLSKSATLALAQLDKLINDINESFKKAFHPEGEEAHDAKLIYITIFENLKIWFASETTADAITKSIHRDSEHGVSLSAIKKFFEGAKKSLIEGQYDSYEIKESKYKSLSERKQKLLMRIIDTYEQLAFFKFLMTNLLAPEFVKAEEEIQDINFENIQHKFNKQSPDTVLFTSNTNFDSSNDYDNNEKIGAVYKQMAQYNPQACFSEYGNFGKEIKNVRSAIQSDFDEIDSKIQDHNHVTTLIQYSLEIKTKINQLRIKIGSYIKKIKELNDKNVAANDKYIEVELPLLIKEFKKELSDLMEEEERLISKYNDNVTQLVSKRNEKIANAIESKNNLLKKLADLPVPPDIPLPFQFDELVKKHAHKEYESLSAESNLLQKQKRYVALEIKEISAAWARINEIREKSHLMAERVANFHKMQLKVLQEVQRNINVISSDLFSLCEEQSVVHRKLVFEGFMPSWLETEGYQSWKKAAQLVLTGLQSIYKTSSDILEKFTKLGDGSAQEQEGEAIKSFIMSKRDEVEGSLRNRLAFSQSESKEIEEKIKKIEEKLLRIQTDLNAKLQSIYQTACNQKNNIDYTIQLDREKFKKHIEAIAISSTDQLDIKSASKDNLIEKEHQNTVIQIQELESCLLDKQVKLNKARSEATGAFHHIIESVNEINKNITILSQLKLEGYFQESFGLLESEFQTLEAEYEEAFKKSNVLCSPEFLSRYQLLEKNLKNRIEEANNLKKLLCQPESKISSKEKILHNNKMVETSKVTSYPSSGMKDRLSPNNHTDDSEPDKKNKLVSPIQKKEGPSFWNRHKCKMMLGLSGFVAGAAGGATAGVFLAPVTWGLSVPVLGIIFGIAGAIAGLAGGTVFGSIIDYCLQPNVDDEPPLSVNEDKQISAENCTVQQVIHSAPKNIKIVNLHTSGSSRNMSQSSSPKMFQPKNINKIDSPRLTRSSYTGEARTVTSNSDTGEEQAVTPHSYH